MSKGLRRFVALGFLTGICLLPMSGWSVEYEEALFKDGMIEDEMIELAQYGRGMYNPRSGAQLCTQRCTEEYRMCSSAAISGPQKYQCLNRYQQCKGMCQ